MRICIPHPFKEGEWIYLLFDSVHVFKCVYNNFVNKKYFNCPDFDGQKVEPDIGHIEELYNLELGQPIKYAHKLNHKVLHPQPIEKTKVDLANRMFHESTIAALDYYSEHGYPLFKGTSIFFKIIRTWWDIVNVKNPKMGKKTRNPIREPISMDDTGGLEFLKKFADWVKLWKEMNDTKHGLSAETFMTLQQTTNGLIGLCTYLLEEKGFTYVLTGQISSDAHEGRYGWYRQLGGANYYLSVCQFLEAEKKIRLQMLIKLGNLSFDEACQVMKNSQSQEDTQEEAKKLLALISFDFGSELNVANEEGILFFFAGFLARAEAKRLNCDSCVNLFAKERKTPIIHLDDDLGDSKDRFLQQINGGGLFTPTDSLYICVLHARQLFKEVFDKGDIEKQFLSVKNQQSVFSAMFEMKMRNDENAAGILEQTCDNFHKFSERIASIGGRVFNTFSKNIIAEINDEIHKSKIGNVKTDPKQSSSARKIKKLQSD